jgi:hypothetical protein
MEDKDRIQEILERLVRMEVKLDDFTSIRNKSEESYNMSVQNAKEIAEMKDNSKWLTRAVVGEFIVILGTMLIKFM